MAKSTGLLFIALALAAGGLVLMAGGEGGTPGIRVVGDCDEIIVTNEPVVARRIVQWAIDNPTAAAPTFEDHILRVWTHLAGCAPKPGTIMRGVDNIPVAWVDYVQMMVSGWAPGLEGAEPTGLDEELLSPLRPTLVVPVFGPSGNGNGNGGGGPFTPPGGRG